MSTDRISIAILEEFVKKVRFASKSNQKSITMPIHEADTLVHNINLVVLRLLDKYQVQEENKTSKEDVVIVNMDGGGFDEKR
jgi:hypothetical protein